MVFYWNFCYISIWVFFCTFALSPFCDLVNGGALLNYIANRFEILHDGLHQGYQGMGSVSKLSVTKIF